MDFNTDYILNPYAKQAMEDLKQDYDNFMDKNLPVNSIYCNLDGTVKSHDYRTFGIVANTPGLDGSALGFKW